MSLTRIIERNEMGASTSKSLAWTIPPIVGYCTDAATPEEERFIDDRTLF